jgi:hypothetical protein
MSKLRVNAFTVSADGFGAGPDQGRDQPLGRGGEQRCTWWWDGDDAAARATRALQQSMPPGAMSFWSGSGITSRNRC